MSYPKRPWKAVRLTEYADMMWKDGADWHIFDADNELIAEGLDKRTAHLIAAAPELLEALENIIEMIQDCELIHENVPYMRRARAAIAKARGEE